MSTSSRGGELNSNAINLGGLVFGELKNGIMNETAGNAIPAMNEILANGSSASCMGSPQRRH